MNVRNIVYQIILLALCSFMGCTRISQLVKGKSSGNSRNALDFETTISKDPHVEPVAFLDMVPGIQHRYVTGRRKPFALRIQNVIDLGITLRLDLKCESDSTVDLVQMKCDNDLLSGLKFTLLSPAPDQQIDSNYIKQNINSNAPTLGALSVIGNGFAYEIPDNLADIGNIAVISRPDPEEGFVYVKLQKSGIVDRCNGRNISTDSCILEFVGSLDRNYRGMVMNWFAAARARSQETIVQADESIDSANLPGLQKLVQYCLWHGINLGQLAATNPAPSIVKIPWVIWTVDDPDRGFFILNYSTIVPEN